MSRTQDWLLICEMYEIFTGLQLRYEICRGEIYMYGWVCRVRCCCCCSLLLLRSLVMKLDQAH